MTVNQQRLDIHFIAKDSVDNIARIKAASWKVLAVEAAAFTFVAGIGGFIGDLNVKFMSLGFYALSIFLGYVVCAEYPRKLMKYRKRLKRALKTFDKEAQDIHGELHTVDLSDCGDRLYFWFCFSYILFFVLAFTFAGDGYELLKAFFTQES